jgi:hypothetical protein
MSSIDDLVTNSRNLSQNLSQLIQVIQTIFPRTTGSFTFTAAATHTITQPAIKANSLIVLIPTNAAAATLVGSAKSPYVSTITPGASFVVSTASGASAAGTETFSYVVTTPV